VAGYYYDTESIRAHVHLIVAYLRGFDETFGPLQRLSAANKAGGASEPTAGTVFDELWMFGTHIVPGGKTPEVRQQRRLPEDLLSDLAGFLDDANDQHHAIVRTFGQVCLDAVKATKTTTQADRDAASRYRAEERDRYPKPLQGPAY
jgi:hypothetical protein